MCTARPASTAPNCPSQIQQLEARHGVDFIIETLRREPAGTVTLCALGPLTNLGMAFVKAPDIVSRVQEIVLMGGGLFEGGNITPAAEFNIYRRSRGGGRRASARACRSPWCRSM